MNYSSIAYVTKIETGVSIAQSCVYAEGTSYNSPEFKEKLLNKIKQIFSYPPYCDEDYWVALEEFQLQNYDHTKYTPNGDLIRKRDEIKAPF